MGNTSGSQRQLWFLALWASWIFFVNIVPKVCGLSLFKYALHCRIFSQNIFIKIILNRKLQPIKWHFMWFHFRSHTNTGSVCLIKKKSINFFSFLPPPNFILRWWATFWFHLFSSKSGFHRLCPQVTEQAIKVWIQSTLSSLHQLPVVIPREQHSALLCQLGVKVERNTLCLAGSRNLLQRSVLQTDPLAYLGRDHSLHHESLP